MRKIMKFILMMVLICSLTGCAPYLDHYTKEECEALMEDVTGCDITYVSTQENSENKQVIHLFQDESGMEFAVISELRQGWFQVGLYRCYISDNYVSAKLKLHRQEIMDILEEYGFVEHMRKEYKYCEHNIAAGEGVNTDNIYLEYPMGEAEENLEVIAKMAAAGAKIDELLSICYDEDYDSTVELSGGDYESFAPGGMNIRFSREEIGYSGEPYKALDGTFFDWSMSEEERWTEEELYEHLKSKLTKALGLEEE